MKSCGITWRKHTHMKQLYHWSAKKKNEIFLSLNFSFLSLVFQDSKTSNMKSAWWNLHIWIWLVIIFLWLSRGFKNIYRENKWWPQCIKSHWSLFWSYFIFQRQFCNLKYRGKNVIIVVFPVLPLFMVKLSFNFFAK